MVADLWSRRAVLMALTIAGSVCANAIAQPAAPAAPRRPDLIITSFSVDRSQFAVTVKNQGEVATPNGSIAVLLMPQSTPMLGVTLPLTLQIAGPLKAGASDTAAAPFRCPPAPPQGLRPPRMSMQVDATVDAGNQIPESNEGNNTGKSVTVTCGG